MEVCRLSSHISVGPHSFWRIVDPQSCHQADHTTPSPLDHRGCWIGTPKRVSQGPVTSILCMITWKEETSTQHYVFIKVRVTIQMHLTFICRMSFSFAGQYCVHAVRQFCHRGLGLIQASPCGVCGEQEWHWDSFFSKCFGFCHHSHSTTAVYPSFIHLLLPFYDLRNEIVRTCLILKCLVTDSQLISHSYHIVDGPCRTTCHFISTSNV